MLQWFSFGIISMVIVCLVFLLTRSQKQNSSNLTILTDLILKNATQNSRNLNLLSETTDRQLKMNQTLTNLLLSKDSMTFQNLQFATNQSSQNLDVEPLSPLDDSSQALALAEQYKAHGLDPNSAFNQEEPVDFATEFGLG